MLNDATDAPKVRCPAIVCGRCGAAIGVGCYDLARGGHDFPARIFHAARIDEAQRLTAIVRAAHARHKAAA